MRRGRRRRDSPGHGLARDLAKGAIAGAVATWVMGRVTAVLYRRESERARRREDRARGGRTAYAAAAERLADRAGLLLSHRGERVAGEVFHYGLGMSAAALYAVLRRRRALAALGIGRGLGFGTSFWLMLDETLTPLLGVTPGPASFPWQTHARGLAGHVVFGGVTDATLALLDRLDRATQG
jgi:hypothetical protein